MKIRGAAMESVIASLIVITLVIGGCGAQRPPLDDSLLAAIAGADGAQVDLSTAVTGEWDSLVVVRPYASDTQVNELLGFDPGLGMAYTSMQDGILTLLLV